jgi:IS5 family transposase
MRRHDQFSLGQPWIAHPHAKELAAISKILDGNPGMAEAVAEDLVRGVKNPETGSRGMSGDQVLRVLVLKQMKGFSYEELHFHVMDSATYRSFCRFGVMEEVPGRSTLAENVKKVRAETLEQINRQLLGHARDVGVEKGRKVRIDATVVETNIHAPTDSSLLHDGVALLTRLLGEARDLCGYALWSDHTKRAKRRMLAVQNAGTAAKRLVAYRDLLKVARKTLGYGEGALEALASSRGAEVKLRGKIAEAVLHLRAVIDQTERRVLRGERVPADQKVVSFFEPHTDIIVKDRRETLYGHKLTLTGGASGMILDAVVESGNPADSTRVVPMLERQREIYGRVPRQASLDGGYASRANLSDAKAIGVKDVCFSKGRGLRITEMVKSTWVYRQLRDFRAGVEGMISYLKRAFGLDRCTWKGHLSFGSYVWASVVSANLLTLARHLLN